ncbi:MAG: hypothetical protein OXU20_42940 [Myxococcales bacterium]|nr:hypothetical protein [Myxococcales bacterium]MDD9970674.1 hypothetical protein [Myxococcales bacterium]
MDDSISETPSAARSVELGEVPEASTVSEASMAAGSIAPGSIAPGSDAAGLIAVWLGLIPDGSGGFAFPAVDEPAGVPWPALAELSGSDVVAA